MSPRTRSAALAVLAGAAALAVASGAPASAASASPAPLPKALYGTAPASYDGVFRQSYALLGLRAADAAVPEQAVTWLIGQQCPDGGFPSYRPTGGTCKPAKEDSNATGAAVQALAAVGKHGGSGHGGAAGKAVTGNAHTAVHRAVGWLKKQQNTDGSWSYNPKGAGDANSTALAVSALRAAGEDPAAVQNHGHSGPDALAALQLGCDAKAGQRGAFAYQPGKKDSSGKAGPLVANDLASAAAALAVAGQALPVAEPEKDAGKPETGCPDLKPADAAAAYLAGTLASHGHHVDTAAPGAKPSADPATTADAALALAASGHREAAGQAVDWLAEHGPAWLAKQPGKAPAATAKLVLAAEATGKDPAHFGGTDLVAKLAASGPTTNAPSASPSASSSAKSDSGGGVPMYWILGCLVVVGIGIGFGLSTVRGRRRSRQ